MYIKDRFASLKRSAEEFIDATENINNLSIKQITTSMWLTQIKVLVYIKDRFYKFESKSQQCMRNMFRLIECISKIVF